MKYFKILPAFILLYFSSLSLFSQIYTSYSLRSILLKSDARTKSVLITNAITDKAADQSPLLGIATWQDSGQVYQASSLIQFDFSYLPEDILKNPDLIESAELVLYPKKFIEKAEGEFSFLVERISQPWTDSLTKWSNQPAAILYKQIKINLSKKDKRMGTDVTKIVRDMVRYNNYGFMLACKDYQGYDVCKWFASSKNADANARPELIIRYAAPNKGSNVVERDKFWDSYQREIFSTPATTVSSSTKK